MLARIMAQWLSEKMGQQFLVENKAAVNFRYPNLSRVNCVQTITGTTTPCSGHRLLAEGGFVRNPVLHVGLVEGLSPDAARGHARFLVLVAFSSISCAVLALDVP